MYLTDNTLFQRQTASKIIDDLKLTSTLCDYVLVSAFLMFFNSYKKPLFISLTKSKGHICIFFLIIASYICRLFLNQLCFIILNIKNISSGTSETLSRNYNSVLHSSSTVYMS